MAGRRLVHDWFDRPLPDNVELGPRSWLYSAFAFLHYRSERPCGVRIGHDSGVYNGTFFDLGPGGEVRIGNFCSLVGAIICTDRTVVIDDYAFLAHEVVIADHAVSAPAPAPRGTQSDPDPRSARLAVRVGGNAWIGARAILLAGARIGEGAIVGAGAVVACPVEPYAIVAGNPARVVGAARQREGGASPIGS